MVEIRDKAHLFSLADALEVLPEHHYQFSAAFFSQFTNHISNGARAYEYPFRSMFWFKDDDTRLLFKLAA